MNKEFSNWKKNALEKLDKSPKGYIDTQVLSLCNTINKHQDFFTLSSCSGRIVLLKGKTKQECCWIYSTHELAKTNDIWTLLELFSGDFLTFRQESVILHVCVSNLEYAQQLIHTAKMSGFNQCGIIAATKKIVVELICDASLIVPVVDEKLLIERNYLEVLIKEANKNLEKSWEHIRELEEHISYMLEE